MVSFAIARIVLVILPSAIVLGAPTKTLGAAALLQNGQQAQKLNAAFQSMKETDPCKNDDKACLLGSVAACQNGKWAISQGSCAKSQACFALPNAEAPGTLVTCTTEQNALSAIKATGASGGVFGNATDPPKNEETVTSPTSGKATECRGSDDKVGEGNSNNESDSDDCPNETSSVLSIPTSTVPSIPPSTSVKPNTSSSTSRSSPVPTLSTAFTFKPTSTVQPTVTAPTVTVTITLGNEPTTLPPVTRTLSPQEASSVLSSLMANGATIIEDPASLPTTA